MREKNNVKPVKRLRLWNRQSMKMSIEKLGTTFFARVTGINVAKMTNAQTNELQQAYLDHKVLVIEDQSLEAADFDAFGKLFGDTVEHPVKNFAHPDFPKVMILSNSTRHGKPVGVKDAGSFWHSDRSYMERTADSTMLYSVEIPEEGGDTLFADLEAIYESLPNEIKKCIDGRYYISQYRWSVNRGDPESRWNMLTKEELMNTPAVERPLVRTHPETGRKGLFVFPGISAGVKGIKGMEALESTELLDELFDHMTKSEFIFRFQWRDPGTIVLWDNRCVMHCATTKQLPHTKTRTLYRLSTIGEIPH